MRQVGRFVVTAVVVLSSVACEDNSPSGRFHACIRFAYDGLANAQPRDIECELSKTVWVLGVPQRSFSVDVYKTAGVPETVALDLARGDRPTPRWCVLEEAPRAEASPGVSNDSEFYRQFHMSCVDAERDIESLIVLHGHRFSVTTNQGELLVKAK